MPNSSDDPASVPPPSDVSEAPAATSQDSTEEAHLPGSSSLDGEPHRPRRRRRRRRRPQAAVPLQNAKPADETQPQEEPPTGGAGQEEQTSTQTSGLPPRRRRRRSRGPRREVSPQAELGSDVRIDQNEPLETAIAAFEGTTPAQSQLSPNQGAGVPPPGFRRRRRRPRRRGQTEPGSASLTEAGSERDGEEAAQPTADAHGRARAAPPHERRSSEPTTQQDRTRSRGPRQSRDMTRVRREPGDRDPDRRNRASDIPGRRDDGRRDDGRRDRRTRSGLSGRGREASRKPEQKLYAQESVVDRGFEDISDESEEGGARRVHWTIVKRTVADQKSGKAMSATYVLQRDGAEAEFPNLGAARAAVNKTIVHPEKLTLSKAEHVAAKASR
jgi:hypothetical protein